MNWKYDGELTIHPTDGGQPYQGKLNYSIELPDENIARIRQFVQDNLELILQHKYPVGEAHPWGNYHACDDDEAATKLSNHYSLLMKQVDYLQPVREVCAGVTDKTVMSALLAFRKELVENADLYFPPARQLEAIA
jgi:hypothetical protein